MARPSKSLRQHKHDRTYRPDRHALRVEDDAYEGDIPDPPDDLSQDELAVWSLVVETSPEGMLRRIDESKLIGCCQWYGEYCKVMRALRPMEATDTEYYRLIQMAAISWKHFAASSSQFGMSPLDRNRLKMPPAEKKEDDPLDTLGLIGAPRAS